MMKASDFGVKTDAGKWCYSTNEETFHGSFDTREEAIAEGREENPEGAVFVGQIADVPLHVNGWRIVESMGEQAYERCGDVAEDYLSRLERELVGDLEERLEKAVGEWLTAHGLWPKFYAVEESRRIEHESVDDDAEAA